MRGHGDAAVAVAWHPTHPRLASVALDGSVKVWDPANGQDVLTLQVRAPGGRFRHDAAFSPDGGLLAVAGPEGVYLYDGRPCADRAVIKIQSGGSTSWTAIDPRGRWTLTRDLTGRLVSRNARTGAVEWQLAADALFPRALAAHVDLGRVALTDGSEVVERDAASGKVLRRFGGLAGPAWKLDYSQDGKRLAALSGGRGLAPSDVRITVWDVESGEELHRAIGAAELGGLYRSYFSADLDRIALPHLERGLTTGLFRVWNVADGKEGSRVQRFDAARELAWRTAGRRSLPSALIGPGVSQQGDAARAVELPAYEAQEAAARLAGAAAWHQAEAGKAFSARDWFRASFHLERARELPSVAADPMLDFNFAAALHNFGSKLEAESQRALAIAARKKAAAIYEKLIAAHPKVTMYRRDLANTRMALAASLEALGDLAGSRELGDQALKGFEGVVRADPNSGYRCDLVMAHSTAAGRFAAAKEFERAGEELRRAVELGRELVKDHPKDQRASYTLSAVLHNLAANLDHRGRHDEARPLFEEARALLLKVAGPGADDHTNRDLSNTEMALARVLNHAGKAKEAAALADSAVGRMRQLAARPKPSAFVREHFARTLGTYAGFQARLSRLNEAEEVHEEAVEILRDLVRENPADASLRFDLSAALHNRASFFALDAQRALAAVAGYRRAEKMLEELVDRYPEVPMYRRDLASTRVALGRILSQLDRRTEAVAKLEVAVKEWAALAERHPGIPQVAATVMATRGELALMQGRTDEVVEIAEALQKPVKASEREPYHGALLLAKLGEGLREEGRKDEAERHESRAVELLAACLKEREQTPEFLQRDPGLKGLRDRDDFKKLFEKR